MSPYDPQNAPLDPVWVCDECGGECNNDNDDGHAETCSLHHDAQGDEYEPDWEAIAESRLDPDPPEHWEP